MRDGVFEEIVMIDLGTLAGFNNLDAAREPHLISVIDPYS